MRMKVFNPDYKILSESIIKLAKVIKGINGEGNNIFDKKIIDEFIKLNSFNPDSKISYESVIESAEKYNYEVYEINQIKKSPDIVLLGWVHGDSLKCGMNDEVERGLQIILDNLQKGDIYAPEGVNQGQMVSTQTYEISSFQRFLEKNGKEYFSKNLNHYQAMKNEIIAIGLDNIQNYQNLRQITNLGELYDIAKDDVNLKKEFDLRLKEDFPNLSEEEFSVALILTAELIPKGYDNREKKSIIPALLKLAENKRKNQTIYLTYGKDHIERKVISSALKKKNIDYIVLNSQ